MNVGRKFGLTLLAIVVLWAVTPALACLAPSAHLSCCQGMEMQHCASPATMQCGDCCRVRPADAPQLPGPAVNHAVGSAPLPAPAALAFLPAAGRAIPLASETPIPPGSPGVASILRI
jgi:hypothetical protein